MYFPVIPGCVFVQANAPQVTSNKKNRETLNRIKK